MTKKTEFTFSPDRRATLSIEAAFDLGENGNYLTDVMACVAEAVEKLQEQGEVNKSTLSFPALTIEVK